MNKKSAKKRHPMSLEHILNVLSPFKGPILSSNLNVCHTIYGESGKIYLIRIIKTRYASEDSMGIPKNHYLKGYVDDSRPGLVETLFQATLSGEEEVLASCTLSPEDVFILVERLYWTSLDGDITYKIDDNAQTLVLKYPFSRFWAIITNHFAIAQYSEQYGLAFQLGLQEKLKIDSLKYPHYIRITLPANPVGDEFDNIKSPLHDAGIAHFECRSDIISHAVYIEGMLYQIITDSKKPLSRPVKDMTFDQKIKCCEEHKLLTAELCNIVHLLRELRNKAAHQFSFETDNSSGSHLEIKPVSDELLVGIVEFVSVCEQRYSLKAGKIKRFDNSFRMLAGELNQKAHLTQVITLGKQFPTELSDYFYG